MTLGSNLRWLRNRTRQSFADISRGVGESASAETIRLLEQRDSRASKYASHIARHFGVPLDVLLEGNEFELEEALTATTQPAPLDAMEKAVPAGVYTRIPVVGTAKLGDDSHFFEFETPVGHGDGSIMWASRDDSAYSVRCKGDSMSPRIRHGEYVVVEPRHEVSPGDEVLLRAKDGRVMVKQLAYQRDGMIYLDSVNSAYPRISVPVENVDRLLYVAGLAKSALYIPD
jgi:phage repressor protein C with HTH and peptisase S24 domain